MIGWLINPGMIPCRTFGRLSWHLEPMHSEASNIFFRKIVSTLESIIVAGASRVVGHGRSSTQPLIRVRRVLNPSVIRVGNMNMKKAMPTRPMLGKKCGYLPSFGIAPRSED